MKELILQLEDNVLVPFSIEDQGVLKEFKNNQTLKAKITGAKKARSYLQLKLYWSACKKVADNNESPGWQTKEQVDFQIRVALRFYDPDLIIAGHDGSIAFSYRSIAYKNLAHIEACSFFSDAFEVMARKLDVPVEELLKNYFLEGD